jgi:hypothetical protein
MKKVLIGSAFAMFALIALSSCKKEYSCACTDAAFTVTTETHKGSDAEDACTGASSLVPLKACVPN